LDRFISGDSRPDDFLASYQNPSPRTHLFQPHPFPQSYPNRKKKNPSGNRRFRPCLHPTRRPSSKSFQVLITLPSSNPRAFFAASNLPIAAMPTHSSLRFTATKNLAGPGAISPVGCSHLCKLDHPRTLVPPCYVSLLWREGESFPVSWPLWAVRQRSKTQGLRNPGPWRPE